MKPVCIAEVEQLVLPFDYWETERELEKEIFVRKIENLRYYPDPKNEQEKLFNLQKEYFIRGKDKKCLAQMFLIICEIAKKITVQTSKRYGFKCHAIRLEEISVDSAAIIIEQMEKNDLMIKKSFLAYIRLQVLKTMFGQTQAQKLEKYCRQNNINLFALSDIERQKVKEAFELSEKEKKNHTEEDDEENLLRSLQQ